MTPSDRSLRTPVGLAAGLVALTLLASVPLAFYANAKPAWFLFGFDVIMPVPIVLALRFFRGKWQDPTGLGLGCVAGTILFGSILGYLSIPEGSLGTQGGPVGQIRLLPWLIARIFASVIIGASAVRIGLQGDRGRWTTFLLGSGAAGTALVLMAAIYKFRSSPWMAPREGVAEALRVGSLIALGIFIFACLCGGTHFTIRAFEPREGKTPSTPPAPPSDPLTPDSAPRAA